MAGGRWRRPALIVAVVAAAVGTGVGIRSVVGGSPSPAAQARHRPDRKGAQGSSIAPVSGSTSTSEATTAPSTAPSTAPTTAPSTAPAETPPGPPHVMVVVMENHSYDQIVGSPTAPYIGSLIARYGLATSSFAATHPSLPNYLSLVSGSTQGIASDCSTCTANGTQLADQLQAAGIGWRAYMESMPTPCFTGFALPYDKNHDPFVYAPHIVENPAECDNVVPYSKLRTDLADGSAPPFLWVTPNVDHDMHTGTVRQGDAWLSQQLPMVMRSSWYRAGGIVILTWDEGTTSAGCCNGASGGHVATVVISGATRPGSRLATPVDDAGVLRTIESLYGLPFLGAAADPTSGTLLPLVGRPPARS